MASRKQRYEYLLIAAIYARAKSFYKYYKDIMNSTPEERPEGFWLLMYIEMIIAFSLLMLCSLLIGK